MPTNPNYVNTDKPSYERSKSSTRRRREEEDDKGSVQDCFACGFAYFSRWETDKPFSRTKVKPDAGDLECDKCVTERIYLRNMQLLKQQ